MDPSFQVYWFGRRGILWEELLIEFGRILLVCPAPDILLIHLGGNDVGQQKTLDFILRIQHVIHQIKLSFPDLVVGFSEIIPRLRWIESLMLKPLERVCKRINEAMEKFMCPVYGLSFRYVDLEGGLPGLYRDDVVHLSEICLDILNLYFQTSIELATGFWGGVTGGVS